jgi:hypothetical protein
LEGVVINGAHIIMYSKDAEADRALLRDAVGFPHLDVGHDWLIFRLPPAEVAVHPSEENDRHELYLMCDDVEGAVKKLNARGVTCEPLSTQGWGIVTRIRLPGGRDLGSL